MRNTNITIDYYNTNAEAFIANTIAVDLENNYRSFLQYVPANGKILDFGCGSGRDTKCFLEKGYDVDAIDGSAELCRLAGEYTGIIVKQMPFSEFDEHDKYDGIWACASILHLPKKELNDTLIKLSDGLKQDGYLYTSFKYGDFEGIRKDRYFTYFTEDTFVDFISNISVLKVIDKWITSDARPECKEEQWLNIILQKSIIS